MFSVDNFYDFFTTKYGPDRTGRLPWFFRTHGSKNFYDLVPAGQYLDIHDLEHSAKIWCTPSFIMHDQESFSKDLLDTYRSSMTEQTKSHSWTGYDHRQLAYNSIKSVGWPIFCHSELHSKDIEWIRSINFIDCYYFYHGLISRDWFRHWKHHADLTEVNREWRYRFLFYARDYTGTREYRKDVKQFLLGYQDQVLHNWQGTPVDSDHSAKISVDDARKSAVHIVAETLFDTEKIYLTEKIFKPMVMRQPFIVFGPPGSMSCLRDYGFKTFGSVWDESYDEETDSEKRKEKLFQLISYLHNLDSHRFQLLMESCQDILDHNRTHFFSEQFEKILLNELDSNVTKAIQLQSEMSNSRVGGCFYHLYDDIVNQKLSSTDHQKQRLDAVSKYLRETQPNKYYQIVKQFPWVKDLEIN